MTTNTESNRIEPLPGRDYPVLNDSLHYMTPAQLADALESGDYKIATGTLGYKASNCCLGVYVREIGIDPTYLTNRNNLIDFTYNTYNRKYFESGSPTPPWMTDDIEALLIRINDNGGPWFDYNEPLDYKSVVKSKRWAELVIPFLRLLKVNKDGSLSKRQRPSVAALIKDHENMNFTSGDRKDLFDNFYEDLAKVRAGEI